MSQTQVSSIAFALEVQADSGLQEIDWEREYEGESLLSRIQRLDDGYQRVALCRLYGDPSKAATFAWAIYRSGERAFWS